ncbi:class I SAM-dependent methyltransferase [Rhodococcus erythropolis]|uniref:class I SAM-dependent methyltransferase n=1 Tax=Rhodococcus erythropolis TaxID=1833 RepID=UPI001BE659DD|nr:methyltransferase domain-containing protein [Rhodococcus erythropolis]MBT2269501.1 methyltransferase domain-containing protein [Rhodococcus erythropolis]
MTSNQNNNWQFAKAVLRKPITIGAIAPSSVPVAAELAAVVPTDCAPVVVELGPGTGSVSDAISARLPTGGRHIAVEVDGDLVAYLRHTRPWVETIWGDARDLTGLLDAVGVDRVDAIVCALPWSLIDGKKQREILHQIAEVLTRDGHVSILAYPHAHWLPRARDFRSVLHGIFTEVVRSPVVWRNTPPAVVYRCRQPTSRAISL